MVNEEPQATIIEITNALCVPDPEEEVPTLPYDNKDYTQINISQLNNTVEVPAEGFINEICTMFDRMTLFINENV